MTALFTRDQFADPSDDCGVLIDELGNALTTWVAMRGTITVLGAASIWNTTPTVIREAVWRTAWADLVGDDHDPKQTIEIDGA